MKNPPFIPKMGLFYKIASLVLLTLILAIGVATAVSIKEQTEIIKTELIQKNKIISKHLASSVKNAFWSLNWLFVEKQMQEMANSWDVMFLYLIKPNGEVYLSSGDKEFKGDVLNPELMNSGKQILKDLLCFRTGELMKLIITPIKVGNDKWSLMMGLSLKKAEETKKGILKENIVLGSTIILLGVLVSFWFARGMTRPIKQLVEGTKQIGRGNLDYRLKIKGLDELGDLADSFNSMAEDLKKTTTSRDQLAIEINERKQAEEALRENEQRMEAILRTSPVGIGLVIDRQLGWANETMYRMVGYEEGSLLGQTARVIYPDNEEYERVSRELYSNIMESGAVQVETRWVRKDGTIFDCMIRACSLNSKDPSKGLIVAVADISESKRLETQLQRAEKMEAIGTLAGGVAHDLNNILSGIVSYPDLLLMQLPDGSSLRKPISSNNSG